MRLPYCVYCFSRAALFVFGPVGLRPYYCSVCELVRLITCRMGISVRNSTILYGNSIRRNTRKLQLAG